MSDYLVVVLDGVSQLEYVRATALVPAQQEYLDRLDQAMDAGIGLSGLHIEHPDALQRAQFIAVQLVQAVQVGNEAQAAATCAYLANRIPDLKQVRASTRTGLLSIELVFDEVFCKEIKVEFMRPPVME